MTGMVLEPEQIGLPQGAFAKTHRRRLSRDGRTVLALTQGDYRNYVFPLMTPAGFPVTAERPADHPHHASLWIGADHVHALMPATGGTVEEYTYNFYVEEVFQGRAPGRVLELSCAGHAGEGPRFTIDQDLEWRGPVEWAAPEGRRIALEKRTIAVEAGERRNRIDIASVLSAGDFALRLGPTRHAWFNVRVADTLTVANGGTVRDSLGRTGGAAVSGEGAAWVDFSGPVGGGHLAGVTVIPHPVEGRTPFWFVADWGVITVGAFRNEALDLAPGRRFASRCTVLVHDGEADTDEIARIVEGGGADA